jgi:phosphoglycolate phosphatase-like HAD superfamily hydrolase
MIKGILFDKDGTLIDFSLWRNAGINTIQTILNEYNLNNNKLNIELQRAIGIKENYLCVLNRRLLILQYPVLPNQLKNQFLPFFPCPFL